MKALYRVKQHTQVMMSTTRPCNLCCWCHLELVESSSQNLLQLLGRVPLLSYAQRSWCRQELLHLDILQVLCLLHQLAR